MQVLVNGLAVGAVLFLMAAGLSLLIGAMGILNLAHGAIYMVGAYIGWTLAISQGVNFPVAVLAAGVAAAVLGVILERLFRPLRGLPDEQILLSFGVLYVLMNLAQWIWGPIAKAPFSVPWLDGAIRLGTVAVPVARLAIAAAGVVVAVLLWFVQDRTRVGAIVRAGMDDPVMVRSLGIDLDRIATGVFVLGAAVAGVAGAVGGLVLGASSALAINVLLLALIVVVVGGVGSVPGTFGAAMAIGVLDALSRSWVPEMSSVVLYVLMAAVLVIRPTGLSGRAAV